MKTVKTKFRKRLLICLGSMGLTFLVMLLLMAFYKIQPFGNNSLAAADCKIQYLDFFNYYKDLLNGKNSIEYTLTKGLGSNAIGVFSYYLSSPLNLIMLFFDGSQANTAIDLLIVIKLGLSAAAFSYFLQSRLYDRLSPFITILLSAGYGLSFYAFENGSNLMWLDGMILLPLMLLGTYQVIRRKSIAPLAVPTALSVISNWYTAGINCLFCIIWLVFEFFMSEADPETGAEVPESNVWGSGNPGPVGIMKRFLGTVLRYGAAMLSGILISAAIFLPTVAVMQEGRGSGFYLSSHMQNILRGNILDTISQYRIGGTSDRTFVCLYCGSLAVIGTFAFFLSRRVRIRRKLIAAALLAVTMLIYYWQPLYFTFSLFKRVDSYYSRYGYIGVLVLLFIAAMYLQHVFPSKGAAGRESAENGSLKKTECLLPLLCSVLFCALLLTAGNHPTLEVEGVKNTCIFMLGAGTCTTIILAVRSADPQNTRRLLAGIASAVLVLITIGELYQSGVYTLSNKHFCKIKKYASYVSGTRKQVDKLKKYDSGIYRISQIGWRDKDPETGLTAYYNDALAYNYMGIGGYTSSPENDQMYLLDRLGYKMENLCINIVNTSFIPADSMLGVRYVLSDTDIPGMVKIPELKSFRSKETYENPFSLPLAFVYNGDHLPKHEYHEPFEYLEEIWTALSGEQANIFIPLEVEKTESGNTITWNLKIPGGNVCLYGDLPTKQRNISTLQAGTAEPIGYSQWLSPEIFMIPYEKDSKSVKVILNYEKNFEPEYELFYALDLDRLKELSDKISKGADQVRDFSLDNGSMSCTVTAHEGEKLFLILSRTSGWQTTLNGQSIETEEFAYCLTAIPLVEGENRIERVYRAPGLRRGILISAVGVLLLAAYEFIMRYRKITM